MKILVIGSSPHKKGLSNLLTEHLENWFGDVADKIWVAFTFNLSHNNEFMMVESGVGLEKRTRHFH